MEKNNTEPKKITSIIKESLFDHLGKSSSTRINGYWMTILFTICVICCVSLEIVSAIK